MSREVRRVPADWVHPYYFLEGNAKRVQQSTIALKPLHSGNVAKLQASWDEGKAKWEQGLCSDWKGGWKARGPDEDGTWEDWDGKRPEATDYMPQWPTEQCTHLQMYETCSEGTPISPVMETPEILARWLADNGASAFGGMTASYEGWLATINSDCGSFGMIINTATGEQMSGVEAMARP